MKVEDIMTRDAACCASDAGVCEVAELMVVHDCGEIPVCDERRHVIGVVTDRDIVCRLVAKGKNPLDMRVRDCMSSPVITVTPDMPVEDCSRLMEQYRVRRLPVLDTGGAICGMVSQADLAQKGPHAIALEMVENVSRPNVMASSVGGH
jgi:CBS domain-containing protein